jgi:nucleoid-associated protein YgaU
LVAQDVLGEGKIDGAGSMGVLEDFGQDVSLNGSASARGAHVTLQVFGDNPAGDQLPGPDLNEIHVTLFSDLQGWKLYEVQRGDTLSAIARDEGQNTRADDIFEANRDVLTDPDLIRPGQVLRVPLL